MAILPIDEILPEILGALGTSPNVVIEAPPGAGKTTRVPPAILSLIRGRAIILEPRRLAARLAAERVAKELGQRVGETAGYQVRFEDVSSSATRLLFVTEGVLNRRLVADPQLSGIDAVILDEFHERHLESDLGLALLRRLQAATRPNLKLLVMSATLEADPVARYLHDCPILRSEGRLFPLTTQYTSYSALPLEDQVASAIERLAAQKHSGDILVFLPGAAEIRRAARASEAIARSLNALLLPLYGDLTPAEQDRAVAPAGQRKIILSTNVAESSVTIEGVTAVIDSGLARIASDSPWTGLPTLQIARISKASATQRAGRAARTAPGTVIRLYTAEDFHRRQDHDTPEILRRELTQVSLDLQILGTSARQLAWLDPPPEPAIVAAEAVLESLGAQGAVARRMAQYPLHPRLAKLVLEGISRGVGDDACRVAASLSAGARSIEGELDPWTRRHYEQIRRIVRPGRQTSQQPEPLQLAILSAFPDRVGARRRENQAMLCNGVSGVLTDPLHTSPFFVAVDIEDRSENAAPLIRITSAIQPEWLLDLFPERIRERQTLEWNRSAERVESVNALLYQQLVIEESRGVADPDQAAQLLADRALESGIERFVDPTELQALLARIEFASRHAAISAPDLFATLRELCQGLRSFADLKKIAGQQLLPLLEQRANPQLLNSVAPARIKLPSGRQTRVNYEAGKPPWIASRLQDFFGLEETPRVANNQVPVVVHLLAPNHRPVQMTTDLAGFWQRLYPQVRRELSRRYPKHHWPEKPSP